MQHQDGRCATAAEAIFVQDRTGCATAVGGNAGSADMPFCTMQPAVIALAGNRRLIVVRGSVPASNYVIQGSLNASQVTLVGQQSATIAGGTYSGLVLDGGDVFVRDTSFKVSLSPGVVARNAAVLHLVNVVVDNNPGGGILLSDAAFDIENTTVTNNGPGTLGPTTWGGVFVNGLPTSGPARLQLLTVQSNMGGGLTCSMAVTDAAGVLASANTLGLDISTSCGFMSCAPGPNCGAQQ